MNFSAAATHYNTLPFIQVKAFASAISKGGTVLLNEPKRIVHPETFYCGKI